MIIDLLGEFAGDTGMSFGGLVSTSNIVREDRISVQSDADLLWTISVRKDI